MIVKSFAFSLPVFAFFYISRWFFSHLRKKSILCIASEELNEQQECLYVLTYYLTDIASQRKDFWMHDLAKEVNILVF